MRWLLGLAAGLVLAYGWARADAARPLAGALIAVGLLLAAVVVAFTV